MGDIYWLRVARAAFSRTFGFMGWNLRTATRGAALVLLGIVAHTYMKGWQSVAAELTDDIVYAAAPVAVVSAAAWVWNFLNEPARMDRHLRKTNAELLARDSGNPELTTELQRLHSVGAALLSAATIQHGISPSDVRVWCQEVQVILDRDGNASDAWMFKTISGLPDDYSSYLESITALTGRLNKLRLVINRRIAPALKS